MLLRSRLASLTSTRVGVDARRTVRVGQHYCVIGLYLSIGHALAFSTVGMGERYRRARSHAGNSHQQQTVYQQSLVFPVHGIFLAGCEKKATQCAASNALVRRLVPEVLGSGK